MRNALLTAQFMLGWPFPNAIMQYALPDLEKLSIDIQHLQRKRDRLVAAWVRWVMTCTRPKAPST